MKREREREREGKERERGVKEKTEALKGSWTYWWML